MKKKIKNPIVHENGLKDGQSDKKIKELQEQLKAALSDYQNLKRDMEKRLDFEEKMLRKSIVKEIIELADDIDVALDRVEDEKGWREGVTQILNKFQKVIGNIGAELIEVKEGDKFDSELHEAVSTTSDGKPDTVANVVQNGYILDDVVIRPSRVVVVQKTKK